MRSSAVMTPQIDSSKPSSLRRLAWPQHTHTAGQGSRTRWTSALRCAAAQGSWHGAVFGDEHGGPLQSKRHAVERETEEVEAAGARPSMLRRRWRCQWWRRRRWRRWRRRQHSSKTDLILSPLPLIAPPLRQLALLELRARVAARRVAARLLSLLR